MRSRLFAALPLMLGASLLTAAVLVQSAGAYHQPFTATLIGANEAPNPGNPVAYGSAAVTISYDEAEVCYSLNVENLNPPAMAAHIHQGPPGVAGPIVVPFEPPSEGASSGCVTEVDRALLQAINTSPGDYYVNVHNPEFPAGAIRGQLQ